MSVPATSSKGIASDKPGGTSPSPTEGIVEGVPGPSTLDQIPLPQNEELDDYGETADEEEEEESTEEDCEVISWILDRSRVKQTCGVT